MEKSKHSPWPSNSSPQPLSTHWLSDGPKVVGSVGAFVDTDEVVAGSSGVATPELQDFIEINLWYNLDKTPGSIHNFPVHGLPCGQSW